MACQNVEDLATTLLVYTCIWKCTIIAATQHQVHQLTTQTVSLCETVTLYAQSFNSESRVLSDCHCLIGWAVTLFTLTEAKSETGSKQHQQLQVSRIFCVL